MFAAQRWGQSLVLCLFFKDEHGSEEPTIFTEKPTYANA
jgi:hypothetical protein